MFVWGRASFGRLGLGNLNQDLYSPVECCLPDADMLWKVQLELTPPVPVELCMPTFGRESTVICNSGVIFQAGQTDS
eukprot:487630-Pelagomonas_calceolata.AAC.8